MHCLPLASRISSCSSRISPCCPLCVVSAPLALCDDVRPHSSLSGRQHRASLSDLAESNSNSMDTTTADEVMYSHQPPAECCVNGNGTGAAAAASSSSTQPQQQQQQPTRDASDPSTSYHSLSYAYKTYLRHDDREQEHWEDVCAAYRSYANFAVAQYANHQYRLHDMPESQRKVLPPGLRRDAPEFHRRTALYKEAAIRNQFCLDCILRHAGQPHSQEVISKSSSGGEGDCFGASATGEKAVAGEGEGGTAKKPKQQQKPTDAQMSKVSSVLKSLVRDWSPEGRPERDMAYGPILQQLKKYLPVAKAPGAGDGPKQQQQQQQQRNGNDGSASNGKASCGGAHQPPLPRVCVPGAGVGRLALEISALGYAVQGNEFSLYMLLASDFILNGGIATPQTPLKLSPWLLETRNVHQWHDPLRTVQIPDVDPYTMVTASSSSSSSACAKGSGGSGSDDSDQMLEMDGAENGALGQIGGAIPSDGTNVHKDFSMAAGEFVSIYGTPREKSSWDAVVACFFLDASPSVVEYLQVIHGMLKPGGILINFGPLLWHWSGPAMRPEDTVEGYRERYSYLDKKYLSSVDLCWEDIRDILVNVGFEVVESSSGQRALYTADRRSMMNMDYRCVSFVARKKGEGQGQGQQAAGKAAGVGERSVVVQPSSSDEQQQQAVSDEGSM